MKSQRFHFAPATAPRSYWDSYFGYGLFASFNCLVEAVLFWQLYFTTSNVPETGYHSLSLDAKP